MTTIRKILGAIAFMAAVLFTSSSATAAGCQPGNGVFTACFYSGDAHNKLLLERTDPQINFFWGLGGPYPGGPIFQFSARWQGYFNFTPGNHRFTVSVNEGARLFIDGQLVVDRWGATSSGTVDVSRTLTGGMHLIQFDYENSWSFAYAQLSWSADIGYRQFYVSTSGNDNNDGRTPATAWATPNKVSVSTFQPGDHILFEGGRTFGGQIFLDSNDRGTRANPIVVTSYGTSRATIQAGTSVGLLAFNTAGIEVSNLNFAGSPGNSKDGIQFYTNLPGTTKLPYVRIDSVEISGFGSAGISLFSGAGTSGYEDVRITNVLSHDNVMAGMWMGGLVTPTFAGYSHRNVYIGNSKFYNNTGRVDFMTVSGFGIFVNGTDGAVIEQNSVYNNGQNTFSIAGPMGILAMESNNLLVQRNEVHHMRSPFNDGGGIAFDGGVTNSVMQYNYIHDNEGSGINLSQHTPVRVQNSNNIVRYNISQNDGRKSLSWAGIIVVGPVQNSHIHNNTVYGTPGAYGFYGALLVGGQTTKLNIRNNVFITAGASGGMQQLSVASGQVNLALQNNAYWGSGVRLTLNWGYQTATTLADFRRISGQEMSNGVSVGVETNPLLTSPGTGPSFNDPGLLSTLTAYKPLPGSPLINRGFNISELGVDPGTRDFVGTLIPQVGAFDIGAVEVPSAP